MNDFGKNIVAVMVVGVFSPLIALGAVLAVVFAVAALGFFVSLSYMQDFAEWLGLDE